ncbi:MAG: flagellar basal body P-ring protein FlgI [Armatimonadia bacterium]|nr:flagellar basal body P-ring protein FlgI [Armatimonadia bacterium]
MRTRTQVRWFSLLLALAALLWFAHQCHGLTTRVKDIATISGVTEHKLMGYGLVVGLDGSGDSSRAIFTARSLANMLERFSVHVDADELTVKNVAAVMVVADLPSDAGAGAEIDVLLSSLGDAESLQGGTLLATPLRAGDGEVYAVAQGPVSIGGFNISAGRDQVQRNHPVVGRVPGGGSVVRPVRSGALDRRQICLVLHNPDYTTACRLADAIDEAVCEGAGRAVNSSMVQVTVPRDAPDMVEFITQIEQLSVQPDTPARVVINERTGTVVIGEAVRIAPVAISHGSLTIRVRGQWQVSQPPPFSDEGATEIVPNEEIEVSEGETGVVAIPPQGSLNELVTALNALGVKPRDLIAIIQALETAGALEAEVTIQ